MKTDPDSWALAPGEHLHRPCQPRVMQTVHLRVCLAFRAQTMPVMCCIAAGRWCTRRGVTFQPNGSNVCRSQKAADCQSG